jgi:VWFA-related protein
MRLGIRFFTAFSLASASVLAQSSDQRPIFKSNVREVSVAFRVVDKNNQPVSGITRDDIKVYDDGALRAITSFQGGVANAQVVVLADVSGSMGTVLEPLAGALFNFADIVSKDFEHQPGDVLLSLVPFSDTATMLVDRTSNPTEFKEAVRRLRPGGGTALVDSVMAALQSAFDAKEISTVRKPGLASGGSGGERDGPLRLMQPSNTVRGAIRSKFLVIFTDAGENASSHRWSEIAAAMLGKDVAIYSVIFESGSPDSDFSMLSKITLQSGGKMFRSKVDELQRVYAEIAKEIRSHYQLTFAAADTVSPRIWRNLHLMTNRTGVTIFARAGYCPEAPCQKPDGSFVGGRPKSWNEVLEISRDPGLIVSLKQHLRDLTFEYTPETERAVSDLATNPVLVEKVWSVDRKRAGKNDPSFVAHKADNGNRQVSIDAEICGITIDPRIRSLPVERTGVPAFVVVDPEIRIARRPGAPQISGGTEEAYFQSQAIFYLADVSGRNPAKIRVQCNRPNFLISEDLVQFAAEAVRHGLKTKPQTQP